MECMGLELGLDLFVMTMCSRCTVVIGIICYVYLTICYELNNLIAFAQKI